MSCAVLLLAGLPGASPARHGPPPAEGTASEVQEARTGAVYEIDRRSHPTLNTGWRAFVSGSWSDPTLEELPELAQARLLHVEGDWALIWLERAAAEQLRARGVRLSAPRRSPAKQPRTFPERDRAALPDPQLSQSIAYAVSAEQMMGHLDEISTVLQTRYYNTAGMVAATQYVFDRFEDYGLDDVFFDEFTYNGYAVRNVIGVKIGSVYPDRIYMLCGHLDSTSPDPQTQAPGAEDNGGGSVGVLEAARLLGSIETESTIYFVCFTAEEQGLIGSSHLAQIADQENWDLRGVLNMDMIAFDTAGAPDIWLEGFYSNPGSIALMDLLEVTATTYTDMEVYRYPSDGWGSDHVPFNQHGFPALLAIDYNWNNYSCYHQTCDVVGNLVSNQLRRMVVTVTVAGSELAGAQSSLGWIDGVADRTDSQDDTGIAIEVAGTTYPPATSGEGGTFTLLDLLPGTYTLRASALGYGTVEVPVTILAGQATPVTIPLDPLEAAIVRGNVGLGEGGAAEGAIVFATGQGAVAVTLPSGDYVLEPVYPGELFINANYPGRMPAVAIVDVPEGGEVDGVDFTLETVWDFEESSDGLSANTGWEWGSDAVAGAHSGSKVWGTRLGTNYANCADYRLDLPPIDLTYYETARLHFWHWYDTESTYDGGNLQVSTDGGSTWSVATPVGGYTDQMSGGCNPLAGQPGYGGSGTTWSEAVLDLAPYVGSAIRLRFWFGSDPGVRDRGWYIDDLSLEGTLQPTGLAEEPAVLAQRLSGLEILPNPSLGGAMIRFQLGEPAAVSLAVYDAAGRKVRSVLEARTLPAGLQTFHWDARDDSGRELPAGIYWARARADGQTLRRRLTILR